MQFWKQFFEASANVSLSGYEEKGEEVATVDAVSYEARNIALYLNGLVVGTNMWSELKSNAPQG